MGRIATDRGEIERLLNNLLAGLYLCRYQRIALIQNFFFGSDPDGIGDSVRIHSMFEWWLGDRSEWLEVVRSLRPALLQSQEAAGDEGNEGEGEKPSLNPRQLESLGAAAEEDSELTEEELEAYATMKVVSLLGSKVDAVRIGKSGGLELELSSGAVLCFSGGADLDWGDAIVEVNVEPTSPDLPFVTLDSEGSFRAWLPSFSEEG